MSRSPGIGNVIILSGYATSPQDVDIITRLATSQVGGNPNNVINAIQVGGVQQVQIDVVIASVNRSEVRNRGFDFFMNGSKRRSFNSVLSGLITPPTTFGGAATAPERSVRTRTSSSGSRRAQFFAALQALRTEGLAKYMAEPRVVTRRPAGRPSFRAGGRQAILQCRPRAGSTGLV